MHNLTKVAAAISLLMPVSAFSLGIGDISLHSALNQNLSAEISLHVSAGEQISNLEVKLAPPEKFDEAGVPWHYFLSKIKFETVEAKNGATIIKVTSKEALREPFLDFLVEVSWDKGSIYREFTVLIDPPVAYTQPVIPLIKQPVKVVEKKPVKTAKKVVKPATVSAKAKVDKPVKTVKAKVKEKAFNGDKYGPVAKNEALWGVAERTNIYQGVTRSQMMLAIYKANPKAFYKKNISALKAGAVLNIPEREVILKLTKKEAQQAYKQQVDEWDGLVSDKAKNKPTSKPAVKKSSNTDLDKNKGKGASLKLKAPSESSITKAAASVSSGGASNDPSIVPKLEETIVSLTEENAELHSKMKGLEQELAVMENMIVLKDQETAVGLKKQAELAREASLDNVVSKAQQAVPAVIAGKPVAVKDPVVADPASVKVKESVAEVEPTVVEPSVVKPVVIDTSVEPEDEGFSVFAIGGLILSGLGLAGWGLWRKRKKEEGELEDSMFASASDIILPDPLEDDGTAASIDLATSIDGEGDAMDSSFLSEFSSSDFHTFDIDPGNDVDPVLEADVYLAYGRYQQAEELMHQAISDHPERDECKLKLLEIFHASDNQSAFEEYTIELEKMGKNKDQEFWAKVVGMGDELDVTAAASSSSDSVLKDEKAGEVASYSIDNSDGSDSPDSSDSLDSLDGEIVPEPTSSMDDKAEVENVVVEEEEDIEFDLSIFDEAESTLEDEVVENELVVAESKSEEGDDFDLEEFDFNSPGPVATSEKEKEKILDQVEEMESVDFDLDSLDLAPSKSSSGDSKKEKVVDTSEFESFDFDSDDTEVKAIEPVVAPVASVEPMVSIDSNTSDLTDMDEIETKIDLAKAYIDMGDYDAARSIAQDAFDQGNDEHKKAAKNILDMLD